MSYPGEPEDDTEGFDLSPADYSTPEAVIAATNAFNAREKARAARMNKDVFAPQQALFDEYAKALKERRTGPDFSQRMYELSAALMKPTAYKGLGATLGNALPVLAQQRAAMRDAENAKQDLLLKYNLQAQELKGEQIKNLLKSEGERDTARLSALKSLYNTMYAPKFVPGVGYVMPPVGGNTAGGQASTRPANVPANYVYGAHTDKNGKTVYGYASPDGTTFIPITGAE